MSLYQEVIATFCSCYVKEGFLSMDRRMLISNLICEGSSIITGRIAHFSIGTMPMCRWGSLLYSFLFEVFIVFYVGFKSILLTFTMGFYNFGDDWYIRLIGNLFSVNFYRYWLANYFYVYKILITY